MHTLLVVLFVVGLRGAIAFALAIRNTENEERQLIFTCMLVIVLITVLINGGFTTLMLQLLKIKLAQDVMSNQLLNQQTDIITCAKLLLSHMLRNYVSLIYNSVVDINKHMVNLSMTFFSFRRKVMHQHTFALKSDNLDNLGRGIMVRL